MKTLSPEEQAKEIVEKAVAEIEKREKWIEYIEKGGDLAPKGFDRFSPKIKADLASYREKMITLQKEGREKIDKIQGLTDEQKKEFKDQVKGQWEKEQERGTEKEQPRQIPLGEKSLDEFNDKAMTKEQMIQSMSEKRKRDSKASRFYREMDAKAKSEEREPGKQQEEKGPEKK